MPLIIPGPPDAPITLRVDDEREPAECASGDIGGYSRAYVEFFGRDRLLREIAVEELLLRRDQAAARWRAGAAGNPQAVHGLPITPARLLPQMAGASLCVSYWNESPDNPHGAPGRSQLEQAVALLGPDAILILDNGAFSVWTENQRRARAGLPAVSVDDEYWDGFWAWAVPVLRRCPQAVAVVPDVIGGSVAENVRLMHEIPETVWGYESQLIVVWHLNEPLRHLRYLLESGYGRLAFGSAGAFRSPGTTLWRNRVRHAFQLIADTAGNPANGIAYPRVHMLRGLAQLAAGEFPFDSADSTNIARNHHLLKGSPLGPIRVAAMRARLEQGAFPSPPRAMWPQSSLAAPETTVQPTRRALQLDLLAMDHEP